LPHFGKIAHGNKKFEGLDFNQPKRTDMCVEVEKYFNKNKIDGPICLLVGDRRPHVEWTKEMNFDPKKVTLPSFFIDTQETREHWARYLTDIEGMDQEMGRVLEFAEKKFGNDFIFLLPVTTVASGPLENGIFTTTVHVSLYRFAGPARSRRACEPMPWSVGWIFYPLSSTWRAARCPTDIDGKSFAPVLLGESKKHREMIFTTNTGDKEMNIFPIRSVRAGQYKYIHNLCPEAYHTNHSDRLRSDGRGAYWYSWYDAAKTDPKAAEIVKRYHTRLSLNSLICRKIPANKII